MTGILREYTEQEFGQAFGTADMRQILTKIISVHLEADRGLFAVVHRQVQIQLVRQAGHSEPMARNHYGNETGQVSNNDVESGLEASRALHRVSYPAPLPTKNAHELFQLFELRPQLSVSTTDGSRQNVMDPQAVADALVPHLNSQLDASLSKACEVFNASASISIVRDMLSQIPGFDASCEGTLARRISDIRWELADIYDRYGRTAEGSLQALCRKDSFLEGQRDALLSIVSEPAQGMLCILPTGGGKSLVWQLAAQHFDPDNTCTIVIVPTRELARNLHERTRALGISSCIFTGSNPDLSGKIIHVVADTAFSQRFEKALKEIDSSSRQIARFVIDEAHMFLTDIVYRPNLAAINRLRTRKEPILMFTGTLSPSHEVELWKAIGPAFNQHLTRIRRPSQRPTIKYGAQAICVQSNCDRRMNFLIQVADAIEALDRTKKDCTLIFVLSCEDGMMLAKRLGCAFSHSNMDPDQHRTNMENWESGKTNFLVITPLLSAGYHCPRPICAVFHVGVPYSLYDYKQSADRCGRDGANGTSVVFFDPQEYYPTPSNHSNFARKELAECLKRRGCIREFLSTKLDGESLRCPSMRQRGMVRTDHCPGSASVALRTPHIDNRAMQPLRFGSTGSCSPL